MTRGPQTVVRPYDMAYPRDITTKELFIKDFLEVFDLTPKDLGLVLDLSVEARETPHARGELLDGDIVFCYFSKPSTRTRVSFAAAVAHLGGGAEFFGPDDLQLGRGETIEDTAMVVSAYARAVVIRAYSHDDVVRFGTGASIPVINALTDIHHPCQALADLLTIRDRFGSFEGLRVAYLGAGNNVAHSLIQACALAGMDIVVATPGSVEVDPMIVGEARGVADQAGSVIELTDDPAQAAKGADVIYTDVWLSMGDPEEEKEERRARMEPYRVTTEIMDVASDRAIFMHCLPAHRGDEVTADVIDGAQSVVAAQAENRMHTEQAMLVALLEGSLTGRP